LLTENKINETNMNSEIRQLKKLEKNRSRIRISSRIF